MADLKEARVPDLGGSSEVPVIELLVKVGDVVKKDQGLVTLESDKATMEVPSAFAGIVREVKVKLGDELSEGSLVAIIEADAAPVGASPGSRPQHRSRRNPPSWRVLFFCGGDRACGRDPEVAPTVAMWCSESPVESGSRSGRPGRGWTRTGSCRAGVASPG